MSKKTSNGDGSYDPNSLDRMLPTLRQFNSYRYIATRTAILRPFFDSVARKKSGLATAKLRVMWRKRLNALREGGWNLLTDDVRKLPCMRNCPPDGFLLPKRLWCCRQPMVCPFCWGRERVLRPFRLFETILYGVTGTHAGKTGANLPVIRPDLKIVRFTRQTIETTLPVQVVDGVPSKVPLTKETVWTHCEVLRRNMGIRRRLEADHFQAEYGSVLLKVFPMMKENCLGMIRCGVLLTKHIPEDYVEKYRERGGKIDIFEPSKKNLCSALSRAFSYPGRLMSSDPAVCAQMLNAMRKARVSSWYGKPVKPKTTFEELE